ncbi:MAG: endonuclease [Polaribacter sp.]|nr:endonuclease [Polaribacter sp.]
MVKKLLSVLFICSFSIVLAQESYYNDVDLTTSGQALKTALATKITATHTNALDYTPGVWEASKATDVNPSNSNEVLLIYGWENGADGTIVNDRERGINNNGGGQGEWNREHVFARSLGNPNLDFVGPGADAHNLRPADATSNSERSNRKFGLGTGNSGNSTDTYPGNTAFYPGDEWKGDVARMMMYMYVRYGDQCLPTAVGVGSTTFTGDAMIDLFLKWNVEDPVSDFEKGRNTFHEDITNNTYAQGNRNPFIDNPYLATRIWGGDSAQDVWGIYTSSDAQAPSVPTALTTSNITTSSITLSWTASTDNVAVTGYDVFVDGVLTQQTTSTSATFSELTPGTTYSFTVLAKDLVNNKSAQSTAKNETTLTDTEAPTVPTNLTVSNTTDTSLTLTWTASTDNTSVTGYDVFIDGVYNATATTTTHTVTGLTASTTYSATVLAKDGAANASAQTTAVNGTTTDGSSNGANELFFSEYVEGSGNNKAVEIANVTNATISLTGYTIKRNGNGGSTWSEALDLASGSVTSIVPGDVFVVINGDADNATLIAQADIVVQNVHPTYGVPINFNGNDPVGLFKNDVLIDIIGDFNSGSQDFAKDVTLRRKSAVTAPTTTYDTSEWDTFAKNTVDNIGIHTSTLAVDDFKIGTFKMYPNPNTYNTLFFNVQQETKISVYNVLGKLVLKKEINQTKNSIDISTLTRGVYLVKIHVGNQFITKKLLKNN